MNLTTTPHPLVALLALLTAFGFLLSLSGCKDTDNLAKQTEAAQADSVPLNAYSLNGWEAPEEIK